MILWKTPTMMIEGPMDREGYHILNFENIMRSLVTMTQEERDMLFAALLRYEAVEIQCKKEQDE